MALTRAVGKAGGHRRIERRQGEAEADLLALHVAHGRIDAELRCSSGLPEASAQ